MIRHPLILAILGMDLMSMLLIGAAAVTAFRIALHWEPHSSARGQIALERAAEAASIQTRYGTFIFFASTLLMVVGIVNVLPPLVPGAMCGTGVLQATGGVGERALFLRIFTVALLFLRQVIERLSDTRPDSPMTQHTARIFLLLAPIAAMAFWSTFNAMAGLDVHKPVDCCAVVYDSVRSGSDVIAPPQLSDSFWIAPLIVGGLLLLGLGLRAWLPGKPGGSMWPARLMAVLSVVWLPVAYMALIRVFAAYHYGVLHHFCPWCLFLRDHYFVGYALFGALLVVLLEGPCSYVALAVGVRYPDIFLSAVTRSQVAGIRLVAALIVFFCIGCLPAILWKLRFGVWL